LGLHFFPKSKVLEAELSLKLDWGLLGKGTPQFVEPTFFTVIYIDTKTVWTVDNNHQPTTALIGIILTR
jgi:hypothetical protein